MIIIIIIIIIRPSWRQKFIKKMSNIDRVMALCAIGTPRGETVKWFLVLFVQFFVPQF